MSTSQRLCLSLAAVASAFALAACDRGDDSAAADQAPSAVTERSAPPATSPAIPAEQAPAEPPAAPALGEAPQDLSGAQAPNAVADAAITATVDAELSKDDKLRAGDIDVDTQAGHVALKGTAPDAASRERATRLALAVKGVVSVDNQLTVGKM